MKKVFTFILFLLCTSNLAYSQQYTVSSFQDEYIELEDYVSLTVETDLDPGWFKRFELGFDFPYYDRVYDYLNADHSSLYYFDDDANFSIQLLGAVSYDTYPLDDPFNLESEVRYKYITENGLKGLVIQFTKNRLGNDPSIEEFNSYVNFQTRFFEDGTVEIRFGEMNLDNSPVYVEGEGFYLLTQTDTILLGPFMGLLDPSSEDFGIGITGAYNDYEVVDEIGILKVLPPEGWVIRFEREPVSTNNIEQLNFDLSPNPTHDYVSIDIPRGTVDYTANITNQLGILIKEIINVESRINLKNLPSGIYYLNILDKNKLITTKKIVKE